MTHEVLLESLRYVPLPDGYEDVFADMNDRKRGLFSFFSIILFPVSRSLFYTLSPWMMKGCYLDEREFRLSLLSPTFEFATWLTISHDFPDELCVEGLKKVYSYVSTIKHRGCRGFAKKEYCDLLLRTRNLDCIVVGVDFDSRSVSVNNKIVEIQAVISCMFNLIEKHPVLRTKIAAAECLQRIASSIKIYDFGRSLLEQIFEQQFTPSPLSSSSSNSSNKTTTTLLDFLQDLFISLSSQNVDIFNRVLIIFCELLCIERFHIPQTSPANRPVTSYFKAFDFLEDIHANGDAQKHLINSRSVAIIFKVLTHLMLPKARHNESSAISSSSPARLGNLHVYVAAKFKDEFWAAYRDNFIVPLLEEERKRVRILISILSSSNTDNDDHDNDDDCERTKLNLSSLTWTSEAKFNAIDAVDHWLVIWSAKRHPRLWFDQYFDQSSPDQKEAWSKRLAASTLPTTRLTTRSRKHFLSLSLEEEHFEKFVSVGKHQTYEQLPWDELIDLWNLVNSSFETPTQTLKRLKKNVEEFLDRSREKETTNDNDEDGGENVDGDTDSTRSDSNTFDFEIDKVIVVDENRHQELISKLFVFEAKLHGTRAVLSSFFRNMLLEYLEMRLVMETELKHSTNIPLLFSPTIVNAIFRACTRPIAPGWNLPEISNVFKSTFLADSSSKTATTSVSLTNHFEQDATNRRRGKKKGETDENIHQDHIINDVVVVGDLDVLQSVALHSDFEKSLMIEAVCEHMQNMINTDRFGPSHAHGAAANSARSDLERYKNNLKHLAALDEDENNNDDTSRRIFEKYYFKGNEEMKYFDTIFLQKE